MTIAIATADLDWVREDPKDQLLKEALDARSLRSSRVPWDADIDWSSFDAVVVSTTWDYHERIAEFLVWIDRVAATTTMWNPPELIRWNADKAYLIEMSEAGVPVIPTVATPTVGSVIDAVDIWGVDQVVIKPVVSASARGTAMFQGDDIVGISDHMASFPDAMIAQPYQPAVETTGEASLVYFNGQYSHAVRKVPTAGDFRTQTHLGGTLSPVEPAPTERAVAELVLGSIAERPLYARIDLVEGVDGPLLIELELIEPALYLPLCSGAPARFAAAIAARLRERTHC
ncbi:cycloserine biosynthesis protein DcsG [bacterium BMS3Bbin02]|nr:cycloserine biosynthesis protein DcsG [bacterium BMS3Bbin02]